jgi:hypothetical protein
LDSVYFHGRYWPSKVQHMTGKQIKDFLRNFLPEALPRPIFRLMVLDRLDKPGCDVEVQVRDATDPEPSWRMEWMGVKWEGVVSREPEDCQAAMQKALLNALDALSELNPDLRRFIRREDRRVVSTEEQ